MYVKFHAKIFHRLHHMKIKGVRSPHASCLILSNLGMRIIAYQDVGWRAMYS